MKLTQEKLAELAGVTSRTVQRIESGEHNVTIESLMLVARALKTDIPALFAPAQQRVKPRPGRPRRDGT